MLAPDNFLYFIALFTINIGCATYLLFSYNRTRIILFNALAFLILAARCCSEYYLPQVDNFEGAQAIATVHSFIFIEFVIIWACTWWYIRPFKNHAKEQLINRIYGALLIILHLPFIPLLYYRIPFKLHPEKIDGYWRYYWDFSTNAIYYYYSVFLFFVLINLSLLILDTIRNSRNRMLKIILVSLYTTIPVWIITKPLAGVELTNMIPSGILNHMIPTIIASWFFTNYRLFRDTSIDVIGDTFDSISDFVVFTSPDFSILQSNQQATQLFQINNYPKKIIDLFTNHSRMLGAEAQVFLNTLIQQGNRREELQLIIDGTQRLFTIKASEYFKGEELFGYTFFMTDITAQRENELKLETQNQELQQLNNIKDRIFAIIGHDLRKPALAFRGITKKVNYLLQKQDYKTLSALGNNIEEEALALNKLTDNLLNWALMEKDVMPYQPTLIRLADIVDENIHLFKNIAKDKSLQLMSYVPEEVQVYADRNAVHTIVRNLIDNAIKYTPQDGQIEVRADRNSGDITIEIRDTGIGIPKEKLQDIFLLQDGKSEEGTAGEKGTGLGLHLVYELVKLNKGSLDVRSRVGEGTAFEVVLPSANLRIAS